MDLSYTHRVLDSARATRRYFAKFDRIIDHIQSVAKLSVDENLISSAEAGVLAQYLSALNNSFTALSYNCLLYTSPSPRDATLSRMPSSA